VRSSDEELSVDGLRFEVRRSSRRRMLEITIDRGGELVISAPLGLGSQSIREFVRQKKLWIFTKLAQKADLLRPSPPKEFKTGEGFAYLGRTFRLLLVDAQDRPFKLEGGRFKLLRSEADRGRLHFQRWYRNHARVWLEKRVAVWASLADVTPRAIRIQDLGHRWASCGRDGTLYFHLPVICLPPGVLDYVVVHELVHIREPNHTPRFWERVERLLPDYERRRRWLAENGATFGGV
jgi:predicted metal-dependent hydrolase